MKIGILSDTHDNLENINKALEIFREKGINFFIHAGDYVAPFSLKPYFEKGFDFIGVFGNNDGEKVGLKEKSKGKIKEPPYIFNLSGKDILIVHELTQIKELNQHSLPSVVISGHTHITEIKKEKNSLFINPGEIGGWLTGRATFAILDLEKMEAEIIELK
ncbi:MAG: metallophosphoesterase [Candidatus Omnitrophica bacterium]|nr:metallophosphoesterase [Candidatus Omnitrophota bacterium]MCM8798582.1 metallophosphoesterase [Candidatus Omnitrophota bacterium]